MYRRSFASFCALVLSTTAFFALGTSPTSAVSTMLPADPARPTVETAPWSGGPYTYDGGDVSDDSAIYANPTTPADSVVIADNKSNGSGSSAGGIGVFSMSGALLQYRQGDGQIGNVDLRTTSIFASGSKVLVGANRRDNSTMRFWILDPATKTLSAPVEVSSLSTGSLNYGFCMGLTSSGANLNAYVLHENGVMNQYRITESSTAGKVTASQVRTFDVGGQSEGCVVDDDNGYLYIGEEDVGIWRYGASSTAGSTRTKIASVGSSSLRADVEGLAIAKGSTASSGYLYASSQGNSTIAVYNRSNGAFVKSITVGASASGSIDAVSATDGVDVSTENLGPGFPDGALVVHDNSNSGGSTSNLKYVPLVGSSPPPPPPPGNETVTIPAVEDAWIDSAAPNTNYGATTYLSSDGSPSFKTALIKFDLTPYIGRTLVSASLNYRTTTSADSGSPGGQKIQWIPDGWSESTATWNTRTAIPTDDVDKLGDIGATSSNTSYSSSLWTSYLQYDLAPDDGWLSVGINQLSSVTNGLDIVSRESTTAAHRPTLTLVLESASGPATSAAERYGWGTPHLSDQFNYTGAPDPAKWSVYNGPGHAGNGTRSPAQVTVNGSALRITGLSNGTTGGMSTASALRGETYGRYETRMRVSARDSEYHPVLIVWPNDGRISSNNCMEIDYAESTSDTTLMKFFLHYNCSGGQSTTSQTLDMTQWHNYAVEWTSTAIRGYIDGELWFTDTDLSHVPDWPAHQTIQLDWFPDGTSTTESWLEVDWWNYYRLP